MDKYGLVDLSSRRLTDFGKELLSMSDDVERSDAFASSILRERNGLSLLEAVRTLWERGVDRIRLQDVREQLRRDGFNISTNNADASKVRQWLELAGVIDKNWVIDETKLAVLLGTPVETLDEWSALTKAQQAFITTLQRVGRVRGERPIPSPVLLDMVAAEHGAHSFNEAQVAAKIYEPLTKGGWIVHQVKKGGRGGKGGRIKPTAKTIQLDLDLAETFKPDRLPPDLRAALGKSPAEIYADLSSTDKHTKGIALELLIVRMAADLGLGPAGLRVRGVKTGGAEVDLIAEGTHLMYSRWIFQCKNTKSVDVSVLSKEVGMATLLQCHVIVIATTGSFTETVRKYARQVNQTTALQVVLLHGAVVNAYVKEGSAAPLRKHFRDSASSVLRQKGPQVLEVLEDLSKDQP
ncbi:hypothetical protein AU189_17740 [Mycolicibacterium acapulense]|nr:hypothetical protein AU189_17740 [Mycolicibacterium acapulense]